MDAQSSPGDPGGRHDHWKVPLLLECMAQVYWGFFRAQHLLKCLEPGFLWNFWALPCLLKSLHMIGIGCSPLRHSWVHSGARFCYQPVLESGHWTGRPPSWETLHFYFQGFWFKCSVHNLVFLPFSFSLILCLHSEELHKKPLVVWAAFLVWVSNHVSLHFPYPLISFLKPLGL